MSQPVRNASFESLVSLLKDENARKHDIVVPAANIRAKDGVLHVTGADVEITPDGVSTVNGAYLPTKVADEGIAEKLGIPSGYLARCRAEAIDLYDGQVNGWNRGRSVKRAAGTEIVRPADPRSFLLRCFRGGDGVGVARALLSDSYQRLDHLDVLSAALAGVRASGAKVTVAGAALTERRMYVDVFAPEVTALAPVLLEGYRSPFDGPNAAERAGGPVNLDGRDFGYGPVAQPVVFTGFRITNSEVGNGAATITPRLVVKICNNGLVIPAEGFRKVHLGAKLDDGTMQWSTDTQKKSLELVTAKARDAVQRFLSADFLAAAIADIEAKAGKPVTAPADTVKVLGKALGFTQEETDGVLDHFIRGGQMTAGGVLNAVTSFSQTVPDADRADAIEGQALRVLSLI